MTLPELKLYYFDIGSRAFGQIIRFFLHDNGIQFQDIRVKRVDWPAKKKEILASGKYPVAAMPFVEFPDGTIYGGTLPLMRRLTKMIPDLQFKDDEEEYFADRVADAALDWFEENLRAETEEERKRYVEEQFPSHIERMDRIYAHNGGPFALGSKISYPDYYVYQAIWTDRCFDVINEKYTALYKFVAAFRERPVKSFLETLPYY